MSSSFLEIIYALYLKNKKIGLILEIFEEKDNQLVLLTEEIFGYPFEKECKLLGVTNPSQYELSNLDILLYLDKEKDNTPFGILKIEIFNEEIDISKLKKLLCNVNKNVFDFTVLQKIIYEYRISFSLLESYQVEFYGAQEKYKKNEFSRNHCWRMPPNPFAGLDLGFEQIPTQLYLINGKEMVVNAVSKDKNAYNHCDFTYLGEGTYIRTLQ